MCVRARTCASVHSYVRECTSVCLSACLSATRLYVCLTATTTPRVSFHATGLTDTHPAAGAPLLLPRVVHNHGHGYNATTGSFLAPINGTYWFMASTETYLKDTNAQLSLMVDDLNVHFMDTYEDTASQAGSVHAVVRLWAGQRVWLRCAGDSHFWGTPTAFSGFLIYPD